MSYPCTCGHRLGQHEHYRAGMDCSAKGCFCLSYRSTSPFWRLMRRIGRRFARQDDVWPLTKCPQCHMVVGSLTDRTGHKMDCSRPYEGPRHARP